MKHLTNTLIPRTARIVIALSVSIIVIALVGCGDSKNQNSNAANGVGSVTGATGAGAGSGSTSETDDDAGAKDAGGDSPDRPAKNSNEDKTFTVTRGVVNNRSKLHVGKDTVLVVKSKRALKNLQRRIEGSKAVEDMPWMTPDFAIQYVLVVLPKSTHFNQGVEIKNVKGLASGVRVDAINVLPGKRCSSPSVKVYPYGVFLVDRFTGKAKANIKNEKRDCPVMDESGQPVG